jgi:hypothetical protein
MHILPNQINPNTQLDALYASQRAAAKREAANTRKKLLEFASEVAGESDSEEACVVTLEAREESQRQPKQKGREHRKKNDERQSDADDAHNVISDWA